MGLSGLVGAGAAEGLEQILTRQLMQQQQAERERAQRAQEAAQQQRIALDTRSQDFDERTREEDVQQRAIGDMRGQQDKFDAKITRLQGEEDEDSAEAKLQQEIAALMGDPSMPDIDKRGLRLRRAGATAAPHATDAEQAAADEREVTHEGNVANARESAEARYRAPASEPRPPSMTPGQKFQATQSLRKSFDLESRAAREVGMQLSQMQAGIAAARKGDMAAGSQAVLVTFQKILDPESVVRESEYARSSSGQALLSRIQGAMDKLARGGAGVPVEELERFVALAQTFAENQARSAMESKTQIDAVAKEYGIDPSLVTRDIQGGAAQGAAPAEATAPTGGVTHRFINGKIVKVGG